MLPPKSMKNVPNMVPKSPRMLNRSNSKGPPPPVKEKPKYNPFIVPKSKVKEPSPTLSDLAFRDNLTGPCPPKSPVPNGLRDREWPTYDSSYDKYGSLGRKESMGRYKKYQPSSSNSAVGLSMGSPRLVAKNIHVQMTKDNTVQDGPSYANVSGAFPRQSPIMGRRALGPPQVPGPQAAVSPKLHRRQPSEVIKQEVLHAQQQSPVSNSSSNAGASSDNSSSIIHHQPVNLKPVTSIHQVLYQGHEK